MMMILKVGGDVETDENGEFQEAVESDIRRFCVPKINIDARVYYRMVNLNAEDVTEPPVTKRMALEDVQLLRETPLRLEHPCHNQSVERHIKMVSEASSAVAGFDRRDGLIRQKIKSRKLMKVFNTKKEFV